MSSMMGLESLVWFHWSYEPYYNNTTTSATGVDWIMVVFVSVNVGAWGTLDVVVLIVLSVSRSHVSLYVHDPCVVPRHMCCADLYYREVSIKTISALSDVSGRWLTVSSSIDSNTFI